MKKNLVWNGPLPPQTSEMFLFFWTSNPSFWWKGWWLFWWFHKDLERVMWWPDRMKERLILHLKPTTDEEHQQKWIFSIRRFSDERAAAESENHLCFKWKWKETNDPTEPADHDCGSEPTKESSFQTSMLPLSSCFQEIICSQRQTFFEFMYGTGLWYNRSVLDQVLPVSMFSLIPPTVFTGLADCHWEHG